MPTNDDYLRLRRMTGETDKSTTYSNVDLEAHLQEAAGDFNVAAAAIWREKAGAYADLVNIQEAGSSRSNSDLFKHATEQAEHYEAKGGETVTPGTTTGSTTRRIVRL